MGPGVLLSVTRGTPPTQDGNGRAVPGSTSTVSVWASVQPVNGQELLRLPESLRTREVVKVFTRTAALLTEDEATGQPADTFAWNGNTYQVNVVETWPNHWKCLATKVPP